MAKDALQLACEWMAERLDCPAEVYDWLHPNDCWQHCTSPQNLACAAECWRLYFEQLAETEDEPLHH